MMLTIPIGGGRWLRIETKHHRRYGLAGKDNGGKLIKAFSGIQIELFLGVVHKRPHMPVLKEE